jgi:hypothetical protein
MSQKWEYLVEEIRTVDARGLTATINNLAAHGWELMSVNPPLHYFKRPKEEKKEDAAKSEEQDEVYGFRQS